MSSTILRAPPKLPSLKRKAQKPTGFRFVPKGETVMTPWAGDEPWPGFMTGQNSLTEQHAYGALAVIFNNPRREDIMKPPFTGGWPDWSYQISFQTGYTASLLTAVDFVVNQGATTLGIRIQTERYHQFTSSEKHAYDVLQRAFLEHHGIDVVDVYENDLLHDPSGQKYVITMKQAIGRIERINPVVGGTAIRGSKLNVIG